MTTTTIPSWVKQRTGQTACVANPELFQRVSDEEDRTTTLSNPRREAERAELMGQLREAAQACCDACPMLRQCLHQAVTGLPVAGFVAGTTSSDRRRLRSTLAIRQPREDFTLAATGRGQSGCAADPAETVALMQAHPTWPMTRIAAVLGCAEVTVRRHLQRHRNTPVNQPNAPGEQTVEETWHALHAA